MDIKTVTQWMLSEGYMVCHKDKYKVTAKFYEQVTGVHQGIVLSNTGKALVAAPKPVTVNWRAKFIQFILDAKVPRWGESSNMVSYEMNKYNEDAMKVFRTAIEKEGVDYDLLVKSTMLYYNSKSGFKKAIGNYMTQGDWRTDYLMLKEAADTSETLLVNHIKDSTQSNGTAYEIG